MAVAGVREVSFLADDPTGGGRFVDQRLHRVLPEAWAALSALLVRFQPTALVTTAYEGGHPDHDACSFLSAMLARRHGLPAWEFPLYHRRPEAEGNALSGGEPGDLVAQHFLDFAGLPEFVLEAETAPAALAAKRQMMAAYRSQFPFLGEFEPACERFRPQPAYDYSRPPHPGTLNYEAWQWPVTGAELCRAFQAFAVEDAAAQQW